MRHRKFSQRLSRPLGHRRATLRNLAIALLKYQRIKTTRAKAKGLQSSLEHLISLGKQNTLKSRRRALTILNDRATVGELFSRIAPLFKNRSSGFSRIIRLSAARHGDGAEMVLLELTEKLPKQKPTKDKKEKPAQKPTPSEKVEETKPEEKPRFPREKAKPTKKLKPKKFLGGLRKLFKKERDSL